MSKFKNLSGIRFGRLLVDDIDSSKKRTYWICKCDCGNIISIRADSLVNGRTTSCGCYHKEIGSKKSKNKKYNEFKIIDNVCIIITSKNEYIQIDIEDYNKVKKYCWSINSVGYPVARCPEKDMPILMHRLILDVEKGYIVDHKNHNTLDNRKENLRQCTPTQNMMNRTRMQINNTTGEKGVHFHKHNGKYVAYINFNGNRIHIGCFDDIESAIKSRREAELKYFGEYTNLKERL